MALIFQMKPRSDWGPCPIIVVDVSERTFIFRIACVPMTTKEIASAATHAEKTKIVNNNLKQEMMSFFHWTQWKQKR